MKSFIYFIFGILILVLIAYLYKNYNIKRGSKEKIPPKRTILEIKEKLNRLNSKIGDNIYIRIFKKEKILELWIKSDNSYKLFKKYKVCKYSGRLGPKLKEGDRVSPEGFYKIYKWSLNPYSNYHLALNIGYPNSYDKSHKRSGSYIMIHGECVSTGCFAMGNSNIEEIYYLVRKALFNGQKYVNVDIFPFRLEDKNLQNYKDSKWYNFWLNLKEGYDYFNKHKIPPIVVVENKKYKIKK